MKTLTIKDLGRSEHLDRPTMSAVRGGWKMPAPGYSFGKLVYAGHEDASINALQELGQQQNVATLSANGSAFLDGVQVGGNTGQHGGNTIVRR